MSSRERELEALVAQLKRRVHTAAIDGLEQGLGYLLTKRLDLTGESFGAMDDAEVLRIARRCPELEALFVPEDSAMDQRLAKQKDLERARERARRPTCAPRKAPHRARLTARSW